MSLSKKIFITFFIAVTALLGVTVELIDTQAERHEIRRIITHLDNTQAQFQGDFAAEQTHVQTLTQIIVSDQKFRSFLAQIKDNFFPFTAEIGKDTGADFVFMLDDVPEVRAYYALNPALASPLPEHLAAFQMQDYLDNAKLGAKMVSLPDGLYSSHFIPLKENLGDDYAVGLIVVCNLINDQRVSKLLAGGNGFHTVFFNNGQAVAKNTSVELAQAMLATLPAIAANGQFTWNGERYVAKRVLFDPQQAQAGYILAANLDAALQAFKRLQRQILLTGAGILAGGALLFAFIARRITRPLRLITQGTQAIQGGDYAYRIGYLSRDEVGQLASAFNAMAAGLAERELIRNTFNQYVDPAIVSELLSQPDKLKLGGERKEQTVLFSDIAGFTQFSEKLAAEDLVLLLNEYLSAMTAEIGKHQGIIDKFIGDAIMAFWAPQLCGDGHAQFACLAALDMQRALQALRPQWVARGMPEIHMRIGIASGEMIVGNIGSERARNYTCIGDRVNYSSRLEGLNKYYGTEIIVDRTTASRVQGLLLRELDSVRVKGREEGEAIYELLGQEGDASTATLTGLDAYQSALREYRQGRFEAAATLFAGLSDDPPGQMMLKRCRELLQNPPAHWDGIHAMADK